MGDSDNSFPFSGKHKPVFIKKQNAVIGTQKWTRPPKEKKRANVEHKLTEAHRNELDFLVKQWHEISQKAKSKTNRVSIGYAYTLLFQYGLDGKVNAMDQIEDMEFNQAKSYLQERIKIAEKRVPRTKVFGNSEWRNKTISAIHARCRNLNISDETRKNYQRIRFSKDSLADFTDDELQEMYNYVMIGTPKFTTPREKIQSTQQTRENALRVLRGVLEANTNPEDGCFNPKKLTISKSDILKLLENRHPDLFGGISIDEFNKFWSKQQILKCKGGPKLGSGAQ